MIAEYGLIIALLQAAVSLLGFVQQHPSLPQLAREQAVQVAQQAITKATATLASGFLEQPSGSASTTVSLTNFRAIPTSGPAPLTVEFLADLPSARPPYTGYSVDFGDGPIDQQGGGGCADWCQGFGRLHLYTTAGTYAVRLLKDGKTLSTTTIAVSSSKMACILNPERALRARVH